MLAVKHSVFPDEFSNFQQPAQHGEGRVDKRAFARDAVERNDWFISQPEVQRRHRLLTVQLQKEKQLL